MENIQNTKTFKKIQKKRQQFLIYYFGEAMQNGRKAAELAGYAKNNLRSRACLILQDPLVEKAISEMQSKTVEADQILKNQITAELCKIAFSNIKQFMSWANSALVIKDSDEIADEYSAVIEEVTETLNQFGSTLKIKTSSKIAAIRELNKMHGFYTPEKVEVENPDGNMGQNTVIILPSNGREGKNES